MAWGKSGAAALACLIGLATAPAAQTAIHLEPVVDGLERPLFVAHAGDGSGRLFVRRAGGPDPGRRATARCAGDRSSTSRDRVLAGGERGPARARLPSATSPRNGRFFVYYTRQPDGATVVAEFRVSRRPEPRAPDRAACCSRCAPAVRQPQRRHARVRPRRLSLHRRSATAAAAAIPATARRTEHAARQDPAHRRRRRAALRDPAGQPVRRRRRPARDLGAGPAQPLAVLVRPRAPASCSSATSARAASRRSTCSRARPQLRLAHHGGHALLPAARPAATAPGSTPAGRRVPPRARALLDHRRLRLPRRGDPGPGRAPTSSGDFCSGEIFGLRSGADARCCSTPSSAISLLRRGRGGRGLRRRPRRRRLPDHRRRPELQAASGHGRGEAVGQDALGARAEARAPWRPRRRRSPAGRPRARVEPLRSKCSSPSQLAMRPWRQPVAGSSAAARVRVTRYEKLAWRRVSAWSASSANTSLRSRTERISRTGGARSRSRSAWRRIARIGARPEPPARHSSGSSGALGQKKAAVGAMERERAAEPLRAVQPAARLRRARGA